jgi:hypothetical protein
MHPTPTVNGVDEEYVLPTVEALLAGTLALMTGHAQSQDTHQRGLMANKIRWNLGLLAQHGQMSDPFRRVVQRMGQAWGELTGAGACHSGGWMQ